MKTNRIQVCVTPDEKLEIEQWAELEGRSASNYLHQLHKDHKRFAEENGHPQPIEIEVE